MVTEADSIKSESLNLKFIFELGPIKASGRAPQIGSKS